MEYTAASNPAAIGIEGSSPSLSTILLLSRCGAVWLACLVWDQRVGGSNPSTSTIFCLGGEMENTAVLEAVAFMLEGSSPSLGTFYRGVA